MSLRVNNTYEEIGHELGIDTSTAYRTVQRVHARVKQLYIKVSTVDVNAASDSHQMEANAKKIEEKILLAKLSNQQHEIYMLMCRGYSDDEIRLRLIISAGTYRVQKCRINKMKQYLTMV
jgi:DNA-binding NarL/FixJ family response regulator